MHPVETAILKTVVYADLFDWALTTEELYHKLQSNKSVPKAQFQHHLKYLLDTGKLVSRKEIIVLPKRQTLFVRRQKNINWFTQTLDLLPRIIKPLQACPWIEGIFLTGSLSARNSDVTDDIDLLLITGSNRLWLARLWAVFAMEVLKVRRRPGDRNVALKICLNMIMERHYMRLDKSQQNLCTAHEIVHVVPLYSRNGCDQQFLYTNRWVLQYLPHAFSVFDSRPKKEPKTKRYLSIDILLQGLNMVCYRLQKIYMKPKITREKISRNYAFFHPISLKERIYPVFESRIKEIGLIQ